MSNTKIWEALAKTDPAHTKGFQRSGGFKGTAVKPIYCDQRMTEQFGPCGEGWGINAPKFQIVPAEKEVLVYCTVSIWHGSRENIVYGVGGDKIVAMMSSGPRTSDEAFKMAFTDAIGNAMKHLGMSADIHMGLFDDAKYVADLKREFGEEAPAPSAAQAPAQKSEASPFDDEPCLSPDEYISKATAIIRDPKNTQDQVREWWNVERDERRRVGLSQDHVNILKHEMELRFAPHKEAAE